MRKYIALVLLLSFAGLLWAHEDTCLQTENEAVDVEEGTSDEQIGDIQKEQSGNLNQQTYGGDSLIILNDYNDLLQYVPKANFLYTQDYSISDQDSTDTPNSNGWKRYQTCCCISGAVIIVGFVVFIILAVQLGGLVFIH